MSETSQPNNEKDSGDQKKSWFYVRWWWIAIGAAILLAALGLASYGLGVSSQLNFMTVNALSIFVLAAIAGQALIYHRQRVVMESQWIAMKQALVVGNKAIVGVHSIDLDWKSKRVTITLENVGRIPTEDIRVSIEAFVILAKESFPADAEVLRHSTEYDFGRTKLFAGNLKFRMYVVLDKVQDKDLPRVSQMAGAAVLVQGNIVYRDGFGNSEDTEFAFAHFGDHFGEGEDEWMAFPIGTLINGQKEVERQAR